MTVSCGWSLLLAALGIHANPQMLGMFETPEDPRQYMKNGFPYTTFASIKVSAFCLTPRRTSTPGVRSISAASSGAVKAKMRATLVTWPLSDSCTASVCHHLCCRQTCVPEYHVFHCEHKPAWVRQGLGFGTPGENHAIHASNHLRRWFVLRHDNHRELLWNRLGVPALHTCRWSHKLGHRSHAKHVARDCLNQTV